tara:strand:- start:22 stop:399 length:378 start_codon:yes stop_codon:yes gene_type:complete
MLFTQVVLLTFFTSHQNDNLQRIIESFNLMNSNEIISHFNESIQISIDGKTYSENSYKSSILLDDFFTKNDIDSFNMIHKGKSGTSLTYVIGEYLSDKKIYKILIFVDTKKSGNKIREIKIDQKE